jgi:hypothetical protein
VYYITKLGKTQPKKEKKTLPRRSSKIFRCSSNTLYVHRTVLSTIQRIGMILKNLYTGGEKEMQHSATKSMRKLWVGGGGA